MYKFALAVTTFNRLNYLRECLESFELTKCNNTWEIIIADDGSTDGTKEYIKSKKYTLLENNRVGVSNQTNSILQYLNSIRFDCCFKIDDDITFIKEGWSTKYYDTLRETGYYHLVYSEKSRCESFMNHRNKKQINFNNGILKSHCDTISAMGCFYTIIPEMINKIGYFDTMSYGPHESGHVDYTARCCVYGYNSWDTLFDISDSEEYIKLKQNDNYTSSLPIEETNKRRSRFDPISNEAAFIQHSTSRVYVPYNKCYYNMDIPECSVIISTYNNNKIELCLEGLKNQTFKNFETIIINDGGDETELLATIRKYSKHLNIIYETLLPKSTDYRLSAARNLGVTLSRGKRIITTDSDCIPHPEFINKHNKATGILIGVRNRIYQPISKNITTKNIQNITEIPSYYDERHNYKPLTDQNNENSADFCWGCNVSFNKSDILKAGNYDKSYINWGFEDCDLALRIIKNGIKTELDTECIVYHLEHPTRCDPNNEQQRQNMQRYLNKKKGSKIELII